ncbi:PIH1 domain-containing protein 2 [Scyliorhinus canicula]|uniref:PIH1 domain-containing protein 2 n=1 Tax=Scyliorhinus canicula TaxID=7830 RepID=UPI0018F2CC79|nr:PIH1 domain-containing protein 2 [Scyliorhinus canicula]XP_038634556.1 PIH1 domain-containing protein 2 [Scyliorhinus canicula]XP_038634557.1 PIH1 domain-containing protein 2 [Scyliorhinus canicula]
MATKHCEKEMLQQVNQLWSLLDDISENNPEAYQKFIRHHLEEGIKQFSPPEPHTCFQTTILEFGERLLYVNLCMWSCISAPKTESDPVPLAGGNLEENVEGTEIYTVTDVVYSPEVLKKVNEDTVERDQLVRLAMKYIEEQHSLRLSHSYTLMKYKLKGNKKQMKQRLTGKASPAQTAREVTSESGTSLLQQLTSLNLTGKENEENSPPIWLPSDIRHPKKSGLIEEISSTEFDSGNKVETPNYQLSLSKDENEKATTIQLKVELPKVSSVTECNLSVSKNDLVVDVPRKYRLQLDLAETISEDMVTAKFNKKTRILSVTMPIKYCIASELC